MPIGPAVGKTCIKGRAADPLACSRMVLDRTVCVGRLPGSVSAVVYGRRAPCAGMCSRLASLGGQARADARFPHCFGTGTGPSGWKADTNGVTFH